MSRPPINPEKSLAGITVDPLTLERVVPESRRPDGSVRKELRIRQGFTPQEDIRRFRSSKQQQSDANALPKGHIIGWAPPPSATQANEPAKPMTKSAKKNAKRKEKKAETTKPQTEEVVPESWDDGDDEDTQDAKKEEQKTTTTSDEKKSGTDDALAEKLEKLKVT